MPRRLATMPATMPAQVRRAYDANREANRLFQPVSASVLCIRSVVVVVLTMPRRYGLYTALVYLTPLFGGIVADRLVGQRVMVRCPRQGAAGMIGCCLLLLYSLEGAGDRCSSEGF
jgi:hypothetical protein